MYDVLCIPCADAGGAGGGGGCGAAARAGGVRLVRAAGGLDLILTLNPNP